MTFRIDQKEYGGCSQDVTVESWSPMLYNKAIHFGYEPPCSRG
jgi:hypothetical protein